VSTVAEVWPDLKVFVHFGMAMGPYRDRFDALVGKPLACIDTYSSSEGGLNAVQTRQSDPGMQLEVDGGAFYEFCPLDSRWRPDLAERLTLNEVEVDRPYAMLLTTVSGIWAYDVGDIVRFTSLRPPKILFAARTDQQLNAFGEHVLQEHLDRAVAGASHALKTTVENFTVEPVLPTAEDARGTHRWLVEFAGPRPPLEAFARRVDRHVSELSDDYASHRAGEFGMRDPQAISLTPGTFFTWAKQRDKLGGQHKIPRVVLSPTMAEELLAISRSLDS